MLDINPPVEDKPITVPQSALPSLATMIIRHIAQVVAGYLIAHGFLAEGDTELVVGIIVGVAALVYGVIRAKRSHAERVTMAEVLPDSIAKVK